MNIDAKNPYRDRTQASLRKECFALLRRASYITMDADYIQTQLDAITNILPYLTKHKDVKFIQSAYDYRKQTHEKNQNTSLMSVD